MKKEAFITAVGWVLLAVIFVLSIGVAVLIEPDYSGRANTETWSPADTFTLDYAVKLQKDATRDFVILNLADIQVSEGQNLTIIKNQITDLVGVRRPDLITLTGDNSQGADNHTYREIFRFIDSFGIPFAPVFGNHDGEGRYGHSRNMIADFYMTLKNCVFRKGANNLGTPQNPCIGNYVIAVMEGDTIVKTLVMMDSNAYLPNGYDFIHVEQIAWYEWVITGMNAAAGREVENLAFFHIPLQQTQRVYNEYAATGNPAMVYDNSRIVYKDDLFGHSKTDSGMYDKIVELNSTKHIFNGHDHNNNFSLTDANGVTFTYCVKTGNSSYYNRDHTGGTFITITADRKIEIEHKIIPFREKIDLKKIFR